MSWGRIDDGMLEHRKWIELEEAGPRTWADCLAVWVACLNYCNRQASDGVIPRTWLARATPLGAKAIAAADELVRVRLMHRSDDRTSYSMHDFLDYNESRDRRNARRDATARRVREHREGHRNAVTPRVTNDVSSASPGPARPGPAQTPPQESADLARVPAHTHARTHASEGPVTAETRRAEAVRAYLRPIWKQRTGAVPMELSALTPNAEIVAQLAGLPDGEALDAALGRFFDDEAMRRKGWPVGWFLRNPVQWSARSTAKGGHASARKNSEYTALSMGFDELLAGADEEASRG